jgi:hypothetical protein
MFNLHVVIELPQSSWGNPVRQAADSLLANYPKAETKVSGQRQPQRLIDLRGNADPGAAIRVLQEVGTRLNPQGLTLIEASAGPHAGTAAAFWAGYHAMGPASVVNAWLAEGARLDQQPGYTGPVAVQLRYADGVSQ